MTDTTENELTGFARFVSLSGNELLLFVSEDANGVRNFELAEVTPGRDPKPLLRLDQAERFPSRPETEGGAQ